MLSDIQFPTKEIKCGGQSFAVRGLALDMLPKMLAAARVDIGAAMLELETAFHSDKAGDTAAVGASLLSVVTKIPALAANLIAICADEPGASDAAARLPLSAQVEALLAIFALTFDGEDALQKFVIAARTATQTLTQAVAARQPAATDTNA
jgi:hypothetical protein